MELTFLGTSAGRPLPGRNVSSTALRLPPACGAYWLFDCGEGTQQQIMRTPVKLSKLERIFITHLHGDHTFGLPGLLSSRAFAGGTSPVWVYGPPGIRKWIEMTLEITETRLEYELHLVEIEREGTVYEDGHVRISAAELVHRTVCYGYRIEEKASFGKLDVSKLEAYGVPSGPLAGRLKSGEDVTLPDGRIIRSADVVGPPSAGRVITILSDTSPCDNAVMLAKHADVLVHEATFEAGLESKALEYGHCTTVQAAETARKAGAKRLLLTHFSTRYRDERLQLLAEEAKAVFPAAFAAYDLLEVHIPKTK
ncbi:ribonuclease Z [Paenibacillus darwinianus]|uniref:Ribonuclease Z n=1 Tax=Paenibacillus darwinianus TaxID=1380763 RepID=A0A9W5W896_9BACL|nr:ribonuclease Z [Paenibacillus darwinianus]EXX89814.1 ribonuclease Z [Paenibacillus darwinianus]EXX90248.1 ribonuclease Z [Paenibacillus darwinianus]EXX90674.1 ribonuclease Z [Paenibacillus darwinianus]